MDTKGFAINLISGKIIRGLQNCEDLFDFGNLNENHEVFIYNIE